MGGQGVQAVRSDDEWWAEADHGGVVEERVGWGGLLLSVPDGLDGATRGRLRSRLRDAVGAGVRRIVLDLGSTEDVDALTLAALVSARVGMGDGGRVALVAASRHAQLMVSASGADAAVPVFTHRDDAIDYVTGRTGEPRFTRSSLVLR